MQPLEENRLDFPNAKPKTGMAGKFKLKLGWSTSIGVTIISHCYANSNAETTMALYGRLVCEAARIRYR